MADVTLGARGSSALVGINGSTRGCEAVTWEGPIYRLACPHYPYEFGRTSDANPGYVDVEIVLTSPYYGR